MAATSAAAHNGRSARRRHVGPEHLPLVPLATGVGKSTVGFALATRYAAQWEAGDDLVTAVKAMTDHAQQPHLHYWDRHPQAMSWTPARIAELHLMVADAVRPAFEAVIADHVESATPVVLEGDYLVPELALAFGDAVRAVVLDEPDVQRLIDNFRGREPGNGEQRHRAEVSVQVGARLAERAAHCGTAVVAARPWADCLDRTDRALRTASA